MAIKVVRLGTPRAAGEGLRALFAARGAELA